MLKPVRHKKVSIQIYEQIRDMIYRGEFTPGQRLMSERDLALLFKVGRPTVREAIQKLIDHKLIESKRGVGAFVLDAAKTNQNSPLLQVLHHEDFSIVEFLEVRMALESKSAELAAKRATDEDILLIEKSLERMRTEMQGASISIATDIGFHMNIAFAGKNTVHTHVMKSIYDVQYFAMEQAYSNVFRVLGIDELIMQQHQRIADAIKEHNPLQARQSMEEHLTTVLTNCIAKGL